jgi:hypothetical protein
MSVSFRAVGTWAELTADGTVAIPATPQAGDRMYLYARWKDFSVTATVTNWTELVEFADGSSTSGNGTGSVKVACWYRDWQPGDSDPTIDFSANPNNASAVIIVVAKDADDVWLTPVAVTAAMTNWTTSSQSVAASSTTTVLGGGVVMGLIGIRDDTATMTRPTNGIDDSGGLVTWNGNYVEAPATHHSTTTGDDGAADLGYRLVSAGALGVTLRMTGTISAAETGTALWVVQGVEVNLTVASASHGHSVDNVAITQVHGLTVASGSHAQSAESPVLTQVYEIAAQPASHAHIAETLALTQLHELVAQDATHSHAAANVVIVQSHELVAQDASHAHTSDTPVIAVIHNLEVQAASHGHVAESLTLSQVHELAVDSATHLHTAQSPIVKTISIVYLDPGGDAVQAIGHFAIESPASTGDVTFDDTERVVGVGSYRFDSGAGGNQPHVIAPEVLGSSRRVSAYFWYDSLPDVVQLATEFIDGGAGVIYSGSGFTDPSGFSGDEGFYATATPAQNSGQGNVFGSLQLNIPSDSTIVSVKIIYERKYDVDTSIGISRVKWRVNGEEGPNHDNTDMPLTDTVVEVDVTGDMFWEPQHLTDLAFEVIVEARRGDSAVEHTQSIDYAKVVVEYAPATTIMAAYEGQDIAFSLVLVPKGDYGVVRFTEGVALDGSLFTYDGITKLLPDVKNRIGFSYVVNDFNDLDIKVYVNGIEELSIESAANNNWDGVIGDLYYGWVHTPGIDHVCWVDQIFIDEGDDLTDPPRPRCIAKLPATVNEDNWNTTGGTGAVNERPLSETNFKQETRASKFRQSYTLEALDEGDVDLTGKTLVGHMGWAWARRGGGTNEDIELIVDGIDYITLGNTDTPITTTPSLVRKAITTSSYPSNAAGIGMASNNETADTFMYECGVVVAYEGPPNPDILLERQEAANEILPTIIDDLRTDPPDSYELGYIVDELDGLVTINISTLASEGAQWQAYPTEYSNGSKARFPLPAGIEVRIDVEVVGTTNLMIYKRVNV